MKNEEVMNRQHAVTAVSELMVLFKCTDRNTHGNERFFLDSLVGTHVAEQLGELGGRDLELPRTGAGARSKEQAQKRAEEAHSRRWVWSGMGGVGEEVSVSQEGAVAPRSLLWTWCRTLQEIAEQLHLPLTDFSRCRSVQSADCTATFGPSDHR